LAQSVTTHVVQKAFGQALPINSFEELLGHDLVGVHMRQGQGTGGA
jgi:hypothetical protein